MYNVQQIKSVLLLTSEQLKSKENEDMFEIKEYVLKLCSDNPLNLFYLSKIEVLKDVRNSKFFFNFILMVLISLHYS